MHSATKIALPITLIALVLCAAASVLVGCFGREFRPDDANFNALMFVHFVLNGTLASEEDPRQYLDDQFSDRARLDATIQALREPRDEADFRVLSGRGCTITFVDSREEARTVDLQASLSIRDIDIPQRTVTDTTPTKDGIPVIAREMLVRMVLRRDGWKVLSFEPTDRPRPFIDTIEFK